MSDYHTIEELDAIITIRLAPADLVRVCWDQADAASREVFAAQAADDLDAVAWIGMPATDTQPRAWPRRRRDGSMVGPLGTRTLAAAEPEGGWSTPDLPDAVRLAHAVQAATRAAAALGQDEAGEVQDLAARGVLHAAQGLTVDLARATRPLHRLHRVAQHALRRYTVTTAEGV